MYLIGTVLSYALFGCAIGQAILYYTWYQSDSSVTKLMVAVVMILDSVRNIWGSQLLWMYYVQNHGDLFNFLIVSHSGALFQLTEAIMIVLVQWFFVRAIWPLIRIKSLRLPFTAVIMLLTVMGLGSTIGRFEAIIYGIIKSFTYLNSYL